jgi:prolyl oligopeptidase
MSGVEESMNRLILLAGLVGALLPVARASAGVPLPPPTRREVVRETLHGVEVEDPYRWLEDQNSPETRRWIEEQTAHTQRVFSAIPGREVLKKRFAELLKVDTMSAPLERGGRYFFTRRSANQDLAVSYVRRGLSGKDEVLLDPNAMSSDHSVSAGVRTVSQDGKLAAYFVRQGGADETTVRFIDVDTRQELPEQLPSARYTSLALTPDKRGFYYGLYTPEGPRLRYHRFGDDLKNDRELFGAGYGPGTTVGGSVSDNGRWLMILVFHGSAATKTEVYVQDLKNAASPAPIQPVVNDIDAAFTGDIGGDRLYLETDWKAPNRRVLMLDLRKWNPALPASQQWREVIPESQDSIQGTSLAGGMLCVNYLHDVASRVSLFTPEGKHVRDISFPSIGSVSGITGRWDSKETYFSYVSFHIPATVFRYDLGKDARTIWSQTKIPVRSEEMEVRQVWYASKDGTKVPMFLVHRKGLKKDGARPVFLTGYGGFQSSMTPRFSSVAAVWAERGGVFAVPNLRGGGEFGEKWHRAGMLEKKQNVFDDFIAAAEYLIREGYTNPSKLAISGGSNGGLLVGAALTQRPELFRAVVCGAPLLDMVRYHKFLVARFWVPEYGSADDPKQFPFLYAYSPYHHVKPGTRYPAVLFITGDSDTRVAPLHARKMAALLQASGTERPILLQYDSKTGHSGGKPLGKQIDDMADEYGFLLWQLGEI